MNSIEIMFGSMIKDHQYISKSSEMDKIIIYENGDLLYLFNFHPDKSYENY